METNLTPAPASQTVDLTGLPEPVVRDIRRLVETLREKFTPSPAGPPQSIIGLFADQGIETPSLAEFQAARREMWAARPPWPTVPHSFPPTRRFDPWPYPASP